MSDNDKKYFIIAAAVALVLFIALTWWMSGQLTSIEDIKKESQDVVSDVQDLVENAKKREGEKREEAIKDSAVMGNDDIVAAIGEMLRKYHTEYREK